MTVTQQRVGSARGRGEAIYRGVGSSFLIVRGATLLLAPGDGRSGRRDVLQLVTQHTHVTATTQHITVMSRSLALTATGVLCVVSIAGGCGVSSRCSVHVGVSSKWVYCVSGRFVGVTSSANDGLPHSTSFTGVYIFRCGGWDSSCAVGR